MKIMFICTGNTCRSAMAEGLAKKVVSEKNLDVQIYSAGTYAYSGEHASYNAVAVMKEHDVDIALHKSTNINEAKVEEMDLILCLTQKHKIEIVKKYENISNKVYTLKEYAEAKDVKENPDIQDPWGYDLNTYRLCAAEISFYIDKIIEKIAKNQ